MITEGTDSFAESMSYLPEFEQYSHGPEPYLDVLQRAREAVGIPSFGSLDGMTNEGWIKTARMMEEAGADAVMTTSALLKNGIEYLSELVAGLERWLEERDYESAQQIKGTISQRHVADPSAFERSNYIRVLDSYRPQWQ